MKTTMTLAGVVTSVLAIASVAAGQTYVSPNVQPVAGYGGYYPQYHHSSTYEEGVLRGAGALVQSYGQANYYNSLAAINNQEAYSQYLQNREKATETYFRLRQINYTARQAARPQRLTYEQHVALAKKQLPDGLSREQYDRTLGRLHWPVALVSDDFAEERADLDRAFALRTPADSYATSAFQRNVRQLTSTMEATLKTKISEMSPTEYIAAKKFIVGLSYESQQPLVVRTLAAR
jgi:hypothetical protein